MCSTDGTGVPNKNRVVGAVDWKDTIGMESQSEAHGPYLDWEIFRLGTRTAANVMCIRIINIVPLQKILLLYK